MDYIKIKNFFMPPKKTWQNWEIYVRVKELKPSIFKEQPEV